VSEIHCDSPVVKEYLSYMISCIHQVGTVEELNVIFLPKRVSNQGTLRSAQPNIHFSDISSQGVEPDQHPATSYM